MRDIYRSTIIIIHSNDWTSPPCHKISGTHTIESRPQQGNVNATTPAPMHICTRAEGGGTTAGAGEGTKLKATNVQEPQTPNAEKPTHQSEAATLPSI